MNKENMSVDELEKVVDEYLTWMEKDKVSHKDFVEEVIYSGYSQVDICRILSTIVKNETFFPWHKRRNAPSNMDDERRAFDGAAAHAERFSYD